MRHLIGPLRSSDTCEPTGQRQISRDEWSQGEIPWLRRSWRIASPSAKPSEARNRREARPKTLLRALGVLRPRDHTDALAQWLLATDQYVRCGNVHHSRCLERTCERSRGLWRN